MSKNAPPSTEEAITVRFPYTHLSTADTETKTQSDTQTPNSVECELLPAQPCQTDCECTYCGEPWNGGDEWEKRVIEKANENIPQSIGDLHKYKCPNCEEETFQRLSPLPISDDI